MKKKVKKWLFIPLNVLIGCIIAISIWAYVKVQTKATPEVREDVLTDSTFTCRASSDVVYNVSIPNLVFSRIQVEGNKGPTGDELYQLLYFWWDMRYITIPDEIRFYTADGDSIIYDGSQPDIYLSNNKIELMQPHPPIHLYFMHAADIEDLLSKPIVEVGLNCRMMGLVKHKWRPETCKLVRQRYEAVNRYLEGK